MLRQKSEETVNLDRWELLVERLELEDASDWNVRLRGFLAMDEAAVIHHMYRTELATSDTETASLYMFDYTSPKANVVSDARQLTGGCMLSVPKDLSDVSLKVSRRLHKVLESLAASATGSAIIRFPDAPEFNEAVTVYSRDEAGAKRLLTKPARDILQRALYEREANPTFLMGERQLLFTASADANDANRLRPIEMLSADLLTLYAVFKQGSGKSLP